MMKLAQDKKNADVDYVDVNQQAVEVTQRCQQALSAAKGVLASLKIRPEKKAKAQPKASPKPAIAEPAA